MINVMYAIYPHDSVNEPFVLRCMSQGKLVLMEEYQDLACEKCRKVDEKAALARGIQAEVVVRSKRPFLGSSDSFYLLDQRSKEVFATVLRDEIDYFRIPSSPYYVATAKVWLQPEETDPGFRFGRDKCKECGRAREVVWGKVPPTIPGQNRFLAINLESIQGARETWRVSKDVAEVLKKASPPLTGIVLVPKEVDDGRPVEQL